MRTAIKDEIVFSNMPELVTEGKVSDKGAPGTWRSCAYEAEGVQGVMFGCGGETRPEPAVLKLGAKGLYRIWLRLPVFFDPTQIRVRLSGDTCCTRLQAPWGKLWEAVIHEIHWKDADLTDQDLIVEGCYTPDPQQGFLAGIRLEPIDRLPDKPTPDVELPLAMTEDGHGVFYVSPHRRREDLVERYACIPDDTALKIMLWGGASGDHCCYPTKVGEYGGPAREDYYRPAARNLHRNVELWKQKGWDAMETARDYCRSRGWEIHLTMRVQAFAMLYPYDSEGASRFFLDHPEYWCRDREGRTVARMSYAIPEVQEHMLGIIKELSAYDPDGVGLLFIRGVPMVLYEDATVQGFMEEYGEDPRKLHEYDPRWMKYQGDVVNGFMRRVREVLKPGQRLSAMTPGNKFECTRWGMDIETWVKEGLVDDLYPTGQGFTDHDVHCDSPCSLDLEYFQQLEGRERIRLIPQLYAYKLFQQDLRGWQKLVRSFKGRGADGYCVWDGAGHEPEKFQYLGVKDHRPAERPSSSVMKLVMVGDYRVDRYHPVEGH